VCSVTDLFTEYCISMTDQVNPGESYDPLLMSHVKSTLRGGDRLKKDVQALRHLRHGLCISAIQSLNGQDKIHKCL
jgi:hypothetical protein